MAVRTALDGARAAERSAREREEAAREANRANAVALETAMDSSLQAPPEGMGKAWLYVEPDGDVLPAQGVSRVLGNFLTDPWEKIWT